MASVKVNVICAAQQLKVHKLKIEQPHNGHHSFEIAVSSETVEGKSAINIDNSVKFLGEMIEVNMEAKMKLEGNGSTFKGIVTSVNIDRSFATDSLIILSGYSPTYLMEDGKGCQSFENLTGQAIFKKIVANYPINQLNPIADANFTNKIPYYVKYKETNFEFLSRLADMNGEWFYYNGLETIFGKMRDDDDFEIKFGRDLSSFNYGVTMKPTKPENLAYDYVKNNQFEKSHKVFEPNGLDSYGKKALAIANKKFTGGQKFPVRLDIREDGLLRAYTATEAAANVSDSTIFKGEATNPSLTVGSRIKVMANTTISGVKKAAFVNRFRVIKVTHTIDAAQNYSNQFEAIPITILTPPTNKNVILPEAESQEAVVVDNNDPEALGRVRAKFNWQNGHDLTPWIRVVTSSASGGRGMYFIPEIKDEVYIDFDQGNPDRPYVVGTLFHGNAKPAWGSAGNDIKALRTRSGNQIILNDSAGSVTMADPSGNTVTMSGDGEITISAPNKITIVSNDIIIDAANDLTLKAGNNINVEAGNDFTKTVGNNIASSAGNSIEALAATAVQLVGSSLINLNSGGSSVINLLAGGFAEMSGSSEISIDSGGCWGGSSSSGFDINGGSGVKVCGPEVGING